MQFPVQHERIGAVEWKIALTELVAVTGARIFTLRLCTGYNGPSDRFIHSTCGVIHSFERGLTTAGYAIDTWSSDHTHGIPIPSDYGGVLKRASRREYVSILRNQWAREREREDWTKRKISNGSVNKTCISIRETYRVMTVRSRFKIYLSELTRPPVTAHFDARDPLFSCKTSGFPFSLVIARSTNDFYCCDPARNALMEAII